MLRLRVTSEAQPRSKNWPPGPEHNRRRKDELDPHRDPHRHQMVERGKDMATHLQNEHRQDRASAIQKRRVMSASSGLGPVVAVTIAGSSAMPQMGQAPG
jgi:hypothetical protein